MSALLDKLRRNVTSKRKVICDLDYAFDPDTCIGVPQGLMLKLCNKDDGKLFCVYIGFLDDPQRAELRAAYDVEELPISEHLMEVNEKLHAIVRRARSAGAK